MKLAERSGMSQAWQPHGLRAFDARISIGMRGTRWMSQMSRALHALPWDAPALRLWDTR